MKDLKIKINLFLIAILLFAGSAFSQNAPVTTIGSQTIAVGSAIAVPVTVTSFTGIGAITLRIYYNPTQLTFVSTNNVNATLAANMTLANNLVDATSAYIAVVWSDISGQTLVDGSKIFDANFTFNSGPASITFDNVGAAGSYCEYANTIGDVLNDMPTNTYYIDGLISVFVPPSSENDIVSFTLPQQSGIATINTTDHTVSAQVLYSTSLLALVPTIGVSPIATISPLSGAAQDFTTPVSYTVTAEDGTIQVWVVTVTEAPISTDNDILTFSLPQQVGTATINSTSYTVSIDVASGTSLLALIPNITVSDFATVAPLSGTAQDFTLPVNYTVTAQDGSIQVWTVTVIVLSAENDIVSFSFPEQTGAAVINNIAHTVKIEVTAGTVLTALVPTFTVSPLATVNPASGVAQDFSAPFTYTVTAQNGETQTWEVTVTIPQTCSVLDAPYTMIGSQSATLGSTITVPVTTVSCFNAIGAVTLRLYYNPGQLTFLPVTNINASLAANMTIANNIVNATSAYIAVVWSDINGATIAAGSKLFDANFTFIAGPASISFDNVGAAGSFCEYASLIGDVLNDMPTATFYVNGLISVTTLPSSENDIVSFTLPQQTGSATINTTNNTVSVEIAFGASLTSLTPTIGVSTNATISPLSGTAQDFSAPFTYTVTAEDASTQTWVVTVTNSLVASSAKDILSFSFTEQNSPALITNVDHTISIEVVAGTSLASLIPTITVSQSATINPLSGVAQDFSAPFTYTVTAQDGTTQNWIVTVTVAQILSVENDILSFSLPQQTGAATINTTDHTVTIEVNTGTDVTSLTPTITVSPFAVINPASGVALNFTTPFAYAVTSQNGTMQAWTVTVTVLASSENDILTFSLPLQTGAATINTTTHTVAIQVANGTSLTALTPTITVSPLAAITPASGVVQNFTAPFTYTVTAQNGTAQTWVVTVTAAPSSANKILTFTLPQQTGAATINTTDHTVTIEVPYGTDVTALVPTITVSALATISPLSGVAQDFTAPFTYTVTAEDGTIQAWVVTVSIAAASTENDILTFAIPQQTGAATINTTDYTVSLEVPYNTDVTALVPTFTVSALATVTPLSGVAQDFTAPFTYTVTAQSGATQAWVVTVTIAGPVLSTAKDILSFTLTQQTGAAIINTTAHTVAIQVAEGTALTSLVPTIIVSPYATINPASGVAQDFTGPFTYTVTAENGSTQTWVVTVSVYVPQACNVLNAPVTKIGSQSATIGSAITVPVNVVSCFNAIGAITLRMYYNPQQLAFVSIADLNTTLASNLTTANNPVDATTAYIAVVWSDINGATLPDASLICNVNFTFTAGPANIAFDNTNASGSNCEYASAVGDVLVDDPTNMYYMNGLISVTTLPSSANDILSFTLPQQTGAGTVNTTNNTVSIEVQFGTAVTALVPTISVSALATVSPASGVAQDFTAPVTYTVTAEDGTVQTWVVTVTVAPPVLNSENAIVNFSFPQQFGSADINATAHTVAIVVSAGTSLTALVPTITVSPSATINPASGVAQDFTAPFTYTVTAENGSTQAWVVNVTVYASPVCNALNAPVTMVGSQTTAIGSAITVPLTSVSCFDALGAITLRLYYNPTQLTFVSTSDVNAALAANMTLANNLVDATTAYVAVVWSDINGATLAAGSLICNVNFTFISGPASISFDNTGASGSYCEYANAVGDVLMDEPTATYYINGLISPLPLSADATLSSLTTSDGTLSPVFDSGTTTYSVVLPVGTTVIPTVTATATDINATAVVTQAPSVNGAATVVVTAQNGTTLTYTVNFSVPSLSPENDILTFTLPEQTGAATINTTDHTVVIEVANGTTVTALVPTITVSALATITPVSGVAQDFTASVTYTVTAEDGTTQAWLVTVTVGGVPSTDATLSSLTTSDGTLSPAFASGTLAYSVVLPVGTTVVPIITATTTDVNATAVVTQASSVNGSATVIVTAEDGTTILTYTVNFSVPAQSPDNDIVSFTLTQQAGVTTINTTAHTVSLQVVFGTALTALTPAITVSANATISPLSGVAQDFTAPFTYTVTAEDGTTQAWVVTVTVAVQVQSSEKDILTFVLANQASAAVINTVNHTVTIQVTSGSLAALIPTITVSDFATISPVSGVALDFTAPVHYTVTAENGSIRDWTVTVTIQVACNVLNAPVTSIGSFAASAGTQISVPVTVSCFNDIGAITLRLYYDPTQLIYALPTDINPALAANMTIDTTKVNANTAFVAVVWSDISGATLADGSLLFNANFTFISGPATISFDNTILSGSQCEYANLVGDVLIDSPTATYYHNGTITQFMSNENDILTFTLPQQTGSATINAVSNTISVVVPFGTSLTALTPAITVSDFATITPASGVAQNFTAPVTYTVTAENGSISTWTVTVTAVPASIENDILTFTLPGLQTGPATISTTAHTVTVEVISGTLLTSLVPTITVSEFATINPASGVAQDFTGSFTYTVTAQDGSAQAWVVTVIPSIVQSPDNDIISFAVPEQTAVPTVINTTDHTVSFEVPYGTNVTALIPAISVSSGATINPASGVSQNFTNAVTYTVTAQDLTAQAWTVTVTFTVGSTANDIVSFSFPTQVIPATIDANGHTVTIQLPAGTALTALVPTITVSQYATINPASGVSQDFSAPFTYTVTAQDGTTQTWIVNVLVPTSNAPVTTVGSKFSAVAASVVTLPVTVTNFVEIGNIALKIEYNPAVVTYLPTTNSNAALAGLVFDTTKVDATHAFISATWTSGTAVTLANNSKLFDVNFTYVSGSSAITFDNSICEYADVNGNPLNDMPTSTYYVNGLVSGSAASADNDILTFTLPLQTGPATISTTAHTVTIQLPYGTPVTALIPTITVSQYATINPVSGTAQNFTAPFTYTVTAQDGSIQTWVVTVTVALNSAKNILTFSVPQQTAAPAVINTLTHTVLIIVPRFTDVTALIPTITVSIGATISPASGAAQNFTAPFTYTVTAQDGSTQAWVVTVDPSSSVETESSSSFKVNMYPNPTNSVVNFTVESIVGGTFNVEVLNVIGQTVYTTSFVAKENSVQTIDLSSNASGIYFIKLHSEKESAIRRVIKN